LQPVQASYFVIRTRKTSKFVKSFGHSVKQPLKQMFFIEVINGDLLPSPCCHFLEFFLVDSCENIDIDTEELRLQPADTSSL